MLGQRFGRLLVVKEGLAINSNKHWFCVCDCGMEKLVSRCNLIQSHSTSCGCFHRERTGDSHRTHGKSKTRTYKIWKGMRGRCLNKNNPEYKRYGARGISFSARWNKFEAFLEDMGECPEKMSIERVNNNKGYFPSNCKWATAKEQARNTRANRILTLKGKSKTMAEWGEDYGISPDSIWMRLRLGWSHEDAITRKPYERPCRLNSVSRKRLTSPPRRQ